MWRTIIIGKTITSDKVIVTVDFINETISRKFTKEFNLDGSDVDGLKQRINFEISKQDKNQKTVDLIELGDFDYTIIPPTPSKNDSDKEKYIELLDKYRRVQEDVLLDLIKADDAAIVQLVTDLKALYKPEYSGL